MLPSLPSGMQLGTNIRASDQAEHSPPPPPPLANPGRSLMPNTAGTAGKLALMKWTPGHLVTPANSSLSRGTAADSTLTYKAPGPGPSAPHVLLLCHKDPEPALCCWLAQVVLPW